jgi:valyl-tRNA synthetase
MRLVMETITAIRNIRGEMNVPPATIVDDVYYQSMDAASLAIVNRHRQTITRLARVQEIHPIGIPSQEAVGTPTIATPPSASAKAVVDKGEISLPLAGIIDFAEEARRLDKEVQKLNKDLDQAQRKLSNEDFLAKAPEEVVAKEKEKLQAWTEKLTKLKTHQERIRELMG